MPNVHIVSRKIYILLTFLFDQLVLSCDTAILSSTVAGSDVFTFHTISAVIKNEIPAVPNERRLRVRHESYKICNLFYVPLDHRAVTLTYLHTITSSKLGHSLQNL